jgi:hypothetical protein
MAMMKEQQDEQQDERFLSLLVANCAIAHNYRRNFRRREVTRSALLSDGVLESRIRASSGRLSQPD